MTQSQPQLVGVYNAKGSLVGELTYISKKLLGMGHCALCDLSHGWSPREKTSWRLACQQSDLALTMLHLDELDDAQIQALKQAPAILVYLDGWQELMSHEEIKASEGNPEHLFNELESKVESLLERHALKQKPNMKSSHNV